MAVPTPLPPSSVGVTRLVGSDSIRINWYDTNSPCARVLGYNIYKSDNGAVWVRLNNDPVTQTFSLDPEAPYRTGIQYWYQITAVNVTGESDPSDSATIGNTDYGPLVDILPAIIARNQILLDIDGEDGYLLIRKRVGERCHCWDEPTGSGKNRCPSCYGVWFRGGYDQFDLQFRFIPANTQKISLGEGGFVMDNRARMWLNPYPLITSDDVLVRQNGERYFLTDTKEIATRRISTRQESALTIIPSNEIEYTVPIR